MIFRFGFCRLKNRKNRNLGATGGCAGLSRTGFFRIFDRPGWPAEGKGGLKILPDPALIPVARFVEDACTPVECGGFFDRPRGSQKTRKIGPRRGQGAPGGAPREREGRTLEPKAPWGGLARGTVRK